jgi:hypothetical protein
MSPACAAIHNNIKASPNDADQLAEPPRMRKAQEQKFYTAVAKTS